jgi:hypothetical protein
VPFHTLPTYLIANSAQNFDLLFALLDINDSTADAPPSAADAKQPITPPAVAISSSLSRKVWSLLMQLPLNQRSVSRMRHLQATPVTAPSGVSAGAASSSVPSSAPELVNSQSIYSTTDWKSLIDANVWPRFDLSVRSQQFGSIFFILDLIFGFCVDVLFRLRLNYCIRCVSSQN